MIITAMAVVNIYMNYLIRKHILFRIDEDAKLNPIGRILVCIPIIGTITLVMICIASKEW